MNGQVFNFVAISLIVKNIFVVFQKSLAFEICDCIGCVHGGKNAWERRS